MLFTKPARAGRVKTRLIGALTPKQAAALHAAFLGDLGDRLAPGRFHLRVAWALDGDGDRPPVDLVPGADDHVRQQGADLGARLFDGLSRAARGFSAVAAVGSDHPELVLETVERGFARLERADAVFGPAADGGYYLVALRADAVREAIFRGVAWSSETVLEESLERCHKLGLRTELLELGHDVDVAADLRRLAGRLAGGEVACPRTRALLEKWGMIAGRDAG